MGNVIHFGPGDGAAIRSSGRPAVRRPHPVFVRQVDQPFDVLTDRGVMQGDPGDYIAHDPMTGQVWPVSAAYLAAHYEIEGEGGS